MVKPIFIRQSYNPYIQILITIYILADRFEAVKLNLSKTDQIQQYPNFNLKKIFI